MAETLPTVGGDTGAWGPILNTAVGNIDASAERTANKGVANGYASLDGTARLPGSQLTVHTHSVFDTSAAGMVPQSPGGATTYLRADGTWATPSGTGGAGSSFGTQFIDVKADHGAVGDALPITCAITSGSASLTISGATFPASGVVGKTVVVQGAGTGGVPLVTTISTRNSSTNVTLALAASTTVSGATGYWGTNDTTAIQSARDAWLASAVAYTSSSNGDRVLTKALYFPTGKYLVTAQDALLTSPTTGTAAVLRSGHITGPVNATEAAEVIFATTVSSTADPRNGNLMTAANRLHGFTLANMKFRSLNANQNLIYLWCTVAQDGTYPNYGSGAQRRIFMDRIDLRGDWNRGVGLDGDSAANLNSEWLRSNWYVSDSVTFADAMFRSGITAYDTNAQQDQFVNFVFLNMMLEYANGSAFKFYRGGHITVIGGSYVGGVGGSGTVKFFDFARGGGNYWKCHLEVIGVRFEMRTATSRVIYSEWRDQIAHVGFNNCAISANSVGAAATTPFIEVNNTSASSVGHGMYRFVNCEIPGFIQFTGASTQSYGRILVEQCNFTHNPSTAFSTVAAGTGAIRQSGSFAPKYRVVDCWNITDAAN